MIQSVFTPVDPARTTVIITNGVSPLGQNLAYQAKILGYGNRLIGVQCDPTEVPDALDSAGRIFEVDPANVESLQGFRQLLDYFIGPEEDLVFIANRDSRLWSQVFTQQLHIRTRRRYFVGFGTMSGAENSGLTRNRETLAEKVHLKYITEGIRERVPGLESFAVIPGQLNTPELLADWPGLFRLFIGVLHLFPESTTVGEPLPTGLASLAAIIDFGEPGPGTVLSRADMFQAVLDKTGNPSVLSHLRLPLQKNPNLDDDRRNTRIADFLQEERVLHDQIRSLLAAAGILVDPQPVAERLFKHLQSGILPPERQLKLYSEFGRPEEAPILRLLPSLGK